MTSSNVAPHNRTEHDHTWQMLIELALSSEWVNASLAADLVSGIVETLNWSAENLEQLKLAIVQSTRNTINRGHLNGSDALLIIRVLIPEDGETTLETSQADDESTLHQVAERQVQQLGRLPTRGWGFFLIEKVMEGSGRDLRYLLELFLYPGGK